MKNLLFLLVALFSLSCTQKGTKKSMEQGVVQTSKSISVELKNIPVLSDTLHLSKTKQIVISEPFISYKTKNSFVKQVVEVQEDSQDFDFKVDQDLIYLSLRYDFNKYKNFVLSRGDAAVISFEQGVPYLQLEEGSHKKYDFILSDYLTSGDEPMDFIAFIKKHDRYRNLEEELAYKKEVQQIYLNRLQSMDSLMKIGELSEHVYEFQTKSIVYAQERTVSEMQDLIHENTDLHINSFTGMLYRFVMGSIENKILRGASGGIQNSLEAFDFVIEHKDLFEEKAKDYLLWRFIQSIAEDFSKDAFQSRFEVFSEEVSDVALVEEIKREFLVDYISLSKSTGDVILIDNQGVQISLKEFIAVNKGKLVLVDFWASWCAPCRRVMPDSRQIIQDYKDKDFVFLFVSIDNNQADWKKAEAYEELSSYENSKLTINYPEANFFKDLDLRSIPRYVLFDKNGEILHKDAPSPDSQELRQLLDSYLLK